MLFFGVFFFLYSSNCLLLKFLVKLVLIKLHSLNGPQFHKNGFYSDVIKLAKLIK